MMLSSTSSWLPLLFGHTQGDYVDDQDVDT